MTAVERPQPPAFLETAAVGALLLAVVATPLAAAQFAGSPYFLLTLKATVSAILLLPAFAVLILGTPSLGRARKGDGVVAAWFGIGALATAGAYALAPAATRLVEMSTVAAACFLASRARDRGLVRSIFAGGVLPAAAVVAAYSLLQQFGLNPLGLVSEGDDQKCATFTNRNLLAGFLAFAVPIGLEACSGTWRVARAWAILATTLVVAALFLSKTRGAWIGAGVATAVWFLVFSKRFPLLAAVALPLGVLLGMTVAWSAPRWTAEPPAPTRTKSVRERVILARIAVDMLRDRPLLGWGPGNFDAESDAYKAPYFREEGNRGTRDLPKFAHNDALEMSAEMGVPGLLLWLCLAGALLRRGWAAGRAHDGPATAIALGCLAVLLHGLFHFSMHDPVASLLFFAGLGALAPQAPPSEPIGPWFARLVKLGVACAVALALQNQVRVLASRTLFERGTFEAARGSIREGLWTLRRASTLDPAFAQTFAQRAVVLAKAGAQLDALELLDEALSIDPHDEAILVDKGLIHEMRGSVGSAREALRQAIELNPNLSEAYRALARVEKADGHPDREAALLAEAIVIERARREAQ